MATKTISYTTIANEELQTAIKAYKEWQIMEKEAKAEKDRLAKIINGYMTSHDETAIACGEYTVLLTECTQNKFDKDFVKKYDADLYDKCCYTSTYTKMIVK